MSKGLEKIQYCSIRTRTPTLDRRFVIFFRCYQEAASDNGHEAAIRIIYNRALIVPLSGPFMISDRTESHDCPYNLYISYSPPNLESHCQFRLLISYKCHFLPFFKCYCIKYFIIAQTLLSNQRDKVRDGVREFVT